MRRNLIIPAAFALTLTGVGIYLLLKQKKNNMSTQQQNRETTETQPRGYRNNNPLNIRFNSANNWRGKVLPNTDGTFEQFDTMANGYRAALVLIRNYIKAGYDTVSEIISRWAPTNENNTDNYINRVCQTTGYFPYTVVGLNDKEVLCKLAYAMAIVENGYIPLPNKNEIIQGWNSL